MFCCCWILSPGGMCVKMWGAPQRQRSAWAAPVKGEEGAPGQAVYQRLSGFAAADVVVITLKTGHTVTELDGLILVDARPG